MSKFVKTLWILFVISVFVFGQETAGMAPPDAGSDARHFTSPGHVFIAEKSYNNQGEFLYSTTTYTFTDLVIFSYADNSYFYVIDANGTKLDSVSLNENEFYVFSPGNGVFTIEGNQSFSLLIGDPVSHSVMGYFAVDESGSPLSTRLNTYMPVNQYSGEHFIVFAYNDGTEFEIRDLENSSTIAAGILNTGEHFELNGYNGIFLGVTANKPVSALSYTDQGYYIPSTNGTFAGQEFYGYSGYIGHWSNGIIVVSYQDSTDFVVLSSESGDTLFSGRINQGEVASYPVYGDTYWELHSTGNVTVCNTPYAAYSGSYYYLTRQIDETGLGIGTNFYAPVISDDVNLFSYENDNLISIHNMSTDDTTTTMLNRGEGFHFTTYKTVLHIVSDKNISVVSSWGGNYGADFMPLNYTYGLPDLAVSASDITFDPELDKYTPGEQITISAIIHNYGYTDAENVAIKFYDGHPSGNVGISSTYTLGTLGPKGTVQVQTVWEVPDYPEYHDVYVAVDWEDEVSESNNSNNVAYRTLIPNDDLLPPLTTTVDAPPSVGFFADTLEFEDFSITVNIFNTGDGYAENTIAKLNLPSEIEFLSADDSVQYFGNLDPGSSVSFTWHVRIISSTDEDAYFYSVFVDADNADEKLVEEMLVVQRTTAIEQDNPAFKKPTAYRLLSNYPNPFNPVTTIVYELPENCRVDLEIYNLLGEKITTLVSAVQNAGHKQVQWDARNQVSGIYYYRLTTSTGYRAAGKLLLLK